MDGIVIVIARWWQSKTETDLVAKRPNRMSPAAAAAAVESGERSVGAACRLQLSNRNEAVPELSYAKLRCRRLDGICHAARDTFICASRRSSERKEPYVGVP